MHLTYKRTLTHTKWDCSVRTKWEATGFDDTGELKKKQRKRKREKKKKKIGTMLLIT